MNTSQNTNSDMSENSRFKRIYKELKLTSNDPLERLYEFERNTGIKVDFKSCRFTNGILTTCMLHYPFSNTYYPAPNSNYKARTHNRTPFVSECVFTDASQISDLDNFEESLKESRRIVSAQLLDRMNLAPEDEEDALDTELAEMGERMLHNGMKALSQVVGDFVEN